MPNTRRLEQIGDLLRAELSDLLQREMRDPRVGFVTITHVRVSPDLSTARVYVSSLGDEAAQRDSLAALRHAAGFLRTMLGGRIRLRTVPKLDFRLDSSMAEAEQVQRALLRLAPELEASKARERAEMEQAAQEAAEGDAATAAPDEHEERG